MGEEKCGKKIRRMKKKGIGGKKKEVEKGRVMKNEGSAGRKKTKCVCVGGEIRIRRKKKKSKERGDRIRRSIERVIDLNCI